MLNSRCKSIRQIVILSLSLTFSCSSALADETLRSWTRIGPEGGNITQLTVSPSDPQILYASNRSSLYLKSINEGASWVEMPYQQGRSHLTFYSLNPSIVFATDNSGLYKSSDNAMYWQAIAQDLNIIPSSLFSLNSPLTETLRLFTHIEESTDLGITISHDAGEHWALTNTRINTVIENNTLGTMLNTSLTLAGSHPNNPDTLYAYYECDACMDFGVPLGFSTPLYKSTDNGLNWLSITPPELGFQGGLVFDSGNSEKLYATFSGGSPWRIITMVSHNNGQDWEALAIPREGVMTFRIKKLYIAPSDSNILYASLYPDSSNSTERTTYQARIAKSLDSGKNWQVINTSPYIANDLVINAESSEKLLMATQLGIVNSQNSGQDWVLSNTGIHFLGVTHFSVAADNNAIIYLAHTNSSLPSANYYKTTDAGQHWTRFEVREKETYTCKEFKINPQQNKDVLCRTGTKWLRSLDAGDSWNLVQIYSAASEIHNIIYANDGITMYAFTSDMGLSKSINRGISWEKVNSDTNGLNINIVIHPDNPDILYNTTSSESYLISGVYKSVNGGVNWQKLTEGAHWHDHKSIHMHPLDPDQLIFTSGNLRDEGTEFFLTKDAGLSWVQILSPFPESFSIIYQWTFNPKDPNGLFIRTNNGLFKTDDMGLNWHQFNTGLETISNSSTLIFQSSSTDTYARSSNGIFKLTEKTEFTPIADCLFQWAEEQYPDLFSPASSSSQAWGGYVFRHYTDTNTYLGFFHEQEVHLLQTNLSNNIVAVGQQGFYQNLVGCY